MDEYLSILEESGLTRNEANVYLHLLKLGNSSAKNITRLTNMHRTSVYGCLQRLHKKGLVSMITKEDKIHFEAADPVKFLSLIKERESKLRLILPKLSAIRQQRFYTQHEIQYFKGKQGLKTVFEDILNTGEDYLGWGPDERIEEILKVYFLHYIKKRKQKNIHAKLIYYEKSRGKKHTKNPLLNVRYFPDASYSETAHRVYGDNVAIVLLEDDPLTVLIRNSSIAESYRKTFDLLWSISKR
ncbi:MAG: hypothetical protein NDI94_07120 [Candidatus Woesearchaeota archaeon]|nr:hypothetical protein [Candidatus Woesearchaeota archaeon]